MSTKAKKTKSTAAKRSVTKSTKSRRTARTKTTKAAAAIKGDRRTKADVTGADRRPDKMHVQGDNIPDQLKQLPRWVTWNYERPKNKWTKVLLDPKTGRHGSTTDAGTWSDFDTALAASAKADGVGITFGELAPGVHLVGVDLDDCRDPDTGVVDPWAMSIVRMLDSYTEVSPSGTGLKIYCIGRLPEGGRQNGNLECYESGRYFCVTGHVVEGFAQIRTATEDLAVFHARYMDQPRNLTGLTDGEIAVQALDALDPVRADDRGDWLTVGMALHTVGEELCDAWDKWSEQSTKYDAGECAKIWKKFQRKKGITLGTLIHLAMTDGWIPPRKGKLEDSVIAVGKLTIEIVYSERNIAVNVTARYDGTTVAVERLDLTKATVREKLIDMLCDGRQIDRAELTQKLLDKAAALAGRGRAALTEGEELTTEPTSEELLAQMPAAVKVAARAMLESPDLLLQVVHDHHAVGVAGEQLLCAALYLIGTSRKLDKPISAIVQSASSTGKSHCIERDAELFPPEDVVRATSLTTNSLYYMPQGGLRHKYVVAGERSRKQDDDTAEATRALREMRSSGRLSKLVTVKCDGELVTTLIEQEGPIAYVESTTASEIFDEDANRGLILDTDERVEQTCAIVKHIAAESEGRLGADRAAVIDKHHALQRMLEKRQVVIPFATRIATCFDVGPVEARRAFGHLISLIRASRSCTSTNGSSMRKVASSHRSWTIGSPECSSTIPCPGCYRDV